MYEVTITMGYWNWVRHLCNRGHLCDKGQRPRHLCPKSSTSDKVGAILLQDSLFFVHKKLITWQHRNLNILLWSNREDSMLQTFCSLALNMFNFWWIFSYYSHDLWSDGTWRWIFGQGFCMVFSVLVADPVATIVIGIHCHMTSSQIWCRSSPLCSWAIFSFSSLVIYKWWCLVVPHVVSCKQRSYNSHLECFILKKDDRLLQVQSRNPG